MQYPDGGFVDVFVVRGEDGHHLVTDYGDAFGWLRMNSISGKLTPNQRALVDDVALTLGVNLDHGQLVVPSDAASLAERVQRLAQSAARVADISFTFRTRTARTVADDVDEWLRDRSFDVQRAVTRRGRSRAEWLIDFHVHTDRRDSLMFLLSSGARAAARQTVEHVVSGCVDLSISPPSPVQPRLVSLIDDTIDIWRDEDLSLLSDVSELAMWSRRDELEALLRTA